MNDAASRTPGSNGRSAEELRALLDAAVDAVVVIDHKGRIETFNHAAEILFGYAAAEMIGRSVNLLMPEPFRSAHDGYMERYLQTGEARIIGIGREVNAQRRDGTVFPVSLAVGRVGGSEPPRFVGFIRDITALTHAINELRRERDRAQRNEELLQHAQELANLGNFDIHVPSMADDYCSPQLLRILGVEQRGGAAAFAAMIEDTVHLDDREHFMRAWREALRHVHRLNLEYRIRRPDSGVRRVHLLADVSGSAQGARIVGTLHDITERDEALEQVRLAQERLAHVARLSTMGEMAAGLSHEINQPLTAIATYAQACQRLLGADETPVSAELREALSQIGRQALRAGEVIRRLRSMVRNREFRRETIDCNELIRDLAALAVTDARAADVRLTLDLASGLPPVTGDPIQLQQVLLNLVRNAIDALAESESAQREIVVRTSLSAGSDLEIAVIDRGPGVPADVALKLFSPFFTTKPQGTGLGLAISSTIVRTHGGRLGYRANPGGGACFYFTLPTTGGVPDDATSGDGIRRR
jgi:two-component system sensor kinase FixL